MRYTDREMTQENATGTAPVVTRPSKRSRSMRGNFNATKRPRVTFWRRRALPPQQRWALRLVEDYVPSLLADKGGPENVSFAEQRVMETAGRRARVLGAGTG